MRRVLFASSALIVASGVGCREPPVAAHPSVVEAGPAPTMVRDPCRETPITIAQWCAFTRAARVARAKAVLAPMLRRHEAKELTALDLTVNRRVSLADFATRHHCRLAMGGDPTGLLPELEVVRCDVKTPAELTKQVLADVTAPDGDPSELAFETFAECDAIEQPTLRVSRSDVAGQRAIVALPERP